MIRSVVMALVVLWGIVSWGQTAEYTCPTSITATAGVPFNFPVSVDMTGSPDVAGFQVAVDIPDDTLGVALISTTWGTEITQSNPFILLTTVNFYPAGTGGPLGEPFAVISSGCILSLGGATTLPIGDYTLVTYTLGAPLVGGDDIEMHEILGIPFTPIAQAQNLWVDSSQNEVPALPGGRLLCALTVNPGGKDFIRGDVNIDEIINLADPIFLLSSLFGPAQVLCLDASDANDDGTLNIADPIWILAYLFGGGAPPPDPLSSCGQDPTTGDSLDCLVGPPGC